MCFSGLPQPITVPPPWSVIGWRLPRGELALIHHYFDQRPRYFYPFWTSPQDQIFYIAETLSGLYCNLVDSPDPPFLLLPFQRHFSFKMSASLTLSVSASQKAWHDKWCMSTLCTYQTALIIVALLSLEKSGNKIALFYIKMTWAFYFHFQMNFWTSVTIENYFPLVLCWWYRSMGENGHLNNMNYPMYKWHITLLRSCFSIFYIYLWYFIITQEQIHWRSALLSMLAQFSLLERLQKNSLHSYHKNKAKRDEGSNPENWQQQASETKWGSGVPRA